MMLTRAEDLMVVFGSLPWCTVSEFLGILVESEVQFKNFLSIILGGVETGPMYVQYVQDI